MRRFCVLFLTVLCASYCTWETVETSSVEQAFGSSQQGTKLQAIVLQGSVENHTMYGFRFAGATLNGAPLNNLRLEKGELIAEQNSTTLRDDDLEDAHVFAEIKNYGVNPPTTTVVEYLITDIVPESGYDPTNTLNTYLYSISQNVNGTFQPACPVDSDGRRAAIPTSGAWDKQGNRIESSTLFTFGCTTGVIAKCYRWGYRPWVTGYNTNLATTHWACTRMARADYCGNGTTHTRDGTSINKWDNTPAPGPIEQQGTTPPLMFFEAGWSTSGAVCLSHARWLLGGPLIILGCPGKLIAPGLGILNATVCDTLAEAIGQDAGSRIFNESNLNLNLDILGPL
jgi:hypothetical protein